jgi:hypothetical protein
MPYIIRVVHNDKAYFMNLHSTFVRFFFVNDKTIINDISFTPVKKEASVITNSDMAKGAVQKLYHLFGGFEYKFNIVKL